MTDAEILAAVHRYKNQRGDQITAVYLNQKDYIDWVKIAEAERRYPPNIHGIEIWPNDFMPRCYIALVGREQWTGAEKFLGAAKVCDDG